MIKIKIIGNASEVRNEGRERRCTSPKDPPGQAYSGSMRVTLLVETSTGLEKSLQFL